MKRLLVAFVLSLVLLGLTPDAAEGVERPAITAARAIGPFRIDGVLDEPGWAAATVIEDFRLIFQREGETPSESTHVLVLFEEDRLVIGIRCANHAPGPVRASLAPRDQITDGDHIAIHLDTYRDMRRAYVFGVNPYGVQLDGILDGDEPDFSWDAVWDAEATQDRAGWTAEIAVPLSSIRFPHPGTGVWGLWVRRVITKNDEICSWPLWRQSEQGDIMLQAGDLAGLTGLSTGGRLEAEPYLNTLHSRQDSYSLDEDVFSKSRFSTTSLGFDLRYSLTTTLVANATVNPDYSQVEADAIQIDVNRRYPLFFPEKRPFFLEGAELFATPLDLVYTRRMADPGYGGKLTGKLGRWTVGAISLDDDGGGSGEGMGAGFSEEPVRPGQFHIGRIAYDAGENSRLGLIGAAHLRDDTFDPRAIPPGSPLDPVPQGGSNLVLGADSRLRVARRLYFTGQLAWSRTDLNQSADWEGEQLTGTHTISDVAYQAALSFGDGVRHLEGYQTYHGPDFRNESGFVERVDLRQTGVESDFIARPESRWLRSWQPILNGYALHDHTGGLQGWWVSPMIDWVFQKQTHMHTMYVRSMERWLDRDYDLDTYIYNFDNSLWRPLAVSFELEVGDGIFYGPTSDASYRGWAERYTIGATARPDPRFTAELTAERRRFSEEFMGAEVFDIWALGAKTTFQFTRRLFARVYPQYDTEAEHLDADALLGYVVHPGSVLYLGVNGDFDRRVAGQRPTQGTVFLKASHRFGV